MPIRRERRGLPGSDALEHRAVFLLVFLILCAGILALSMATAGLPFNQRGHLPWPIAQWAFATPVGVLLLSLVGAAAAGLPVGLASRAGAVPAHAVDVTDVPPEAWQEYVLSLRRSPTISSSASDQPEHSLGGRIVALLAGAVAIALVLGFFAIYSAVAWYGLTHISDCAGPRCAPSYGYIQGAPLALGLAIIFGIQYVWIRHVERRCGIWFRKPDGGRSPFNYYVRRPGVTAEAAAAAFARYPRRTRRPWGIEALRFALLMVPYFVTLIGLALLAAWLPTQWIPA